MAKAARRKEPAKELPARKRVTVLFSGRGSNMASLIAASMAPDYPAIITHAITNVPGASGLEIATSHNIETAIIDHRDFESREAHEAALEKQILEKNPDIIVLAGYMRILTDDFVRRFIGRTINIHPSLLPSFKGIDTHHRALVGGVRVHGATVHYVDETVDGGAIIAQVAVPVLADDSDESLEARVLAAEHILYPKALAMVASGVVRLSAGRAVLAPTAPNMASEYLISPDYTVEKPAK